MGQAGKVAAGKAPRPAEIARQRMAVALAESQAREARILDTVTAYVEEDAVRESCAAALAESERSLGQLIARLVDELAVPATEIYGLCAVKPGEFRRLYRAATAKDGPEVVAEVESPARISRAAADPVADGAEK